MFTHLKKPFALFFILLIGFSACKTNQKTESTVKFQNRFWELKELNGKPVTLSADAKKVTIQFGTNDFNGNGGCNNMNGLYVIKDDMIKINSVMSTKMFCENAKYETAFFTMLEQCNKYSLKTIKSGNTSKQQLVLMLDEKVLAVLE